MNLFSTLAVEAPKDLWVTLINWIRGSVGNLGWTLILVTLFVKVVTTPLDFMVKLTTKKQTLVQQKCAPQIAKLQKKFGADKQGLQVQTQAIYKREGLNMGTGCLVMLINVILTCTIFLTFYSSLRKVSAYEAINQYEQIEAAYEDKYFESLSINDPTSFSTKEVAKQWFDDFEANEKFVNAEEKAGHDYYSTSEYLDYQESKAFFEANEELFQTATDDGCAAAVEKWKEVSKDSKWLWIQNIWVADSSTAVFPNYDSLKSIAGSTQYSKNVSKINKTDYNKLASVIAKNAPRKNNGYYILAIMAGVITFASQYISDLHNKLKNRKANKVAKANNANPASMKLLKFILPAIMVIFVLTSSASFGLYILASNLASILLGELTTIGVDAITKKQRLAVEAELAKEADRLIRKGQLKE